MMTELDQGKIVLRVNSVTTTLVNICRTACKCITIWNRCTEKDFLDHLMSSFQFLSHIYFCNCQLQINFWNPHLILFKRQFPSSNSKINRKHQRISMKAISEMSHLDKFYQIWIWKSPIISFFFSAPGWTGYHNALCKPAK